MTMTPTNTEAPDELDLLLSDFFKSQLKQPWPQAPVPAASATSEPSELAAARAADAPRNQPAPARRDSTARARFTLAASVALALGACWFLTNGFQPGERPGQGTTPNNGGMLPDSGASGANDLRLHKIQEDKAKGNNGGMNLDPGKFE